MGPGVTASPTTPANMVAMLNSPLWYVLFPMCVVSCAVVCVCVSGLTRHNRDSKAESLQLPHGMHLLLGDISVGAKTPGMVAAVDRWRHALKDQGKLGTCATPWPFVVPQISAHTGPCTVGARWVYEGADDSAWTRLAGLNAQMIGHFRRLNALADERRAAYDSTLERLAALPADQVPSHARIPDILLHLAHHRTRTCITRTRSGERRVWMKWSSRSCWPSARPWSRCAGT